MDKLKESKLYTLYPAATLAIAMIAVLSLIATSSLAQNENNQTNNTTNATNITANVTINATNATTNVTNSTNATNATTNVTNSTNATNATSNVTGNISSNLTNVTSNVTGNVTGNQTGNATGNVTGNATAMANQTNVTLASVNLHIKEWYPKGPDYVFVCNATGMTPIAYSWYYGDGQKLINISNRDTYHVYESLGQKTVQCSATNGVVAVNDTLQINVTSLQRVNGEVSNVTDLTNQTTNVTTNVTQNATQNVTQNITNQTMNQTTNQTNVTVNVTLFSALLNGSSEVPPVDTNATGEVNATLNGTMLTLTGWFRNLSSNMYSVSGSPAHIHRGLPNESGPIAFTLTVYGGDDNRDGILNLTAELTQNQTAELLNGLYYVNVHSVNHTGGEIRGQLVMLNITG